MAGSLLWLYGTVPDHEFMYIIRIVLIRTDIKHTVSVIVFENVKISLRWRHNGCDSVSNHQPHDCLLNRLFRHRSKKTSKFRTTGLCAGNSPGTGEFPAQRASYAENVSIWWRHFGSFIYCSIAAFDGLGPFGWGLITCYSNLRGVFLAALQM